MIFTHRLNTIQAVYENIYKNNSTCFEIDIQLTKDLKLVVYHDDVSDKLYSELLNTIPEIPLFEDFLKYIPSNMTINVEIKKYKNSVIALNFILSITEKYTEYYNHNYIFSSCDKDIYDELISRGKEAWYLIKEPEKYSQDTLHICIHKDLIKSIIPENHKRIAVYGFKNNEIDKENDFITDRIVDY